MDLSIINMEKYIWLDVNMTSFQLVDFKSDQIKGLVKEWMLDEFKGLISPLENEKTFRLNSALIYDSLLLIANTVKRLNENMIHLEALTSINGNCDTSSSSSWNYGPLFMNELKKAFFSGSTGPFYLNELGQRDTFRLKVVSLNKNGLENVGSWDTRRGLTVESFIGYQKFNIDLSQVNRTLHFRVAVVLVITKKPLIKFNRFLVVSCLFPLDDMSPLSLPSG